MSVLGNAAIAYGGLAGYKFNNSRWILQDKIGVVLGGRVGL